MEGGMSKPWLLVFQFRTESGWIDDLSRRILTFETRKEATTLRDGWNTPQLAQRGERYVVRRVK